MSQREQQRRRWMGRGEVAKRFGVSVRTIIRWEADATLGFPRPNEVRGRKYFEEADIDAFQAKAGEVAGC
jgi:DNA-binding transcriptional MerR regulator